MIVQTDHNYGYKGILMGHIGTQVILDNPAYIHESALLYGKIYIGHGVSIWPNVVMRSETDEIRIGARSNVQDFVMIHIGTRAATIVGEDCSITHHVTLHGCQIGDRCLIGINATIMDGAVIGENSIVAGHAIVGENKKFPANSIIAGVPAKKIGEREEDGKNVKNARFYQAIAGNYSKGVERLSADQIKALNL